MVLGQDPEDQLAPYSEHIEMPAYRREPVSEDDKTRMIEHYVREKKLEYMGDFDSLYRKYGSDWNGGRWKKDESGEWWEWSTYNKQSKWDWYELGGRFSGQYIKLKSENILQAAATSRVGSPGVFDNETGIDAALKKNIDFRWIRQEAEDEAAKLWDEVDAYLSEKNVDRTHESWESMISAIPEGDDRRSLIEDARERYQAQPVVKAFEELNRETDHKYGGLMGDGIEPYLVPRELFIKRAGDGSFSPFAVVKDGQWYERGDMGWWGMVADEKDQDEWNAEVAKLLEGLPDDTLISIYDCHI